MVYMMLNASVLSDEHKKHMETFFWDHLVKKEQKTKFVISKEDLSMWVVQNSDFILLLHLNALLLVLIH